ncbi:hypothetical protein RQP46_010782 [Phenoliferia psychrophenolica]
MLLPSLLTAILAASPALSASHRSPPTHSLYCRDTYPDSIPVTGNITGIADVSVVKTAAGVYLLFATGEGLPTLTSTDRLHWTSLGKTFAELPAASVPYSGIGDLWAPDVTIVDGRHLLILPNGDWSLQFGSYFSGIQQMKLDPATGLRADSTVTNISGRPDGAGNEEGSWTYFHATSGFYYLFTSFDACCKGTSSTYNVRVSRARTFDGPFVAKDGVAALDGGGTEILGGHGKFYGPGGQSLLDDEDGPVLFYHYFSATTSILGVNRLDFASGWPVVI